MRYATFGTPEMTERDIKRLKWGEILSFVKRTGRFNTEPTQRANQ